MSAILNLLHYASTLHYLVLILVAIIFIVALIVISVGIVEHQQRKVMQKPEDKYFKDLLP